MAAQAAWLYEEGDLVAPLLPCSVVLELLMGEARQAEACVGNADPACFIAHDFRRDVDQGTLFGLNHLPRNVASVDQNQLPYTAISIRGHDSCS